MKTPILIHIPEPCHENWDAMTPQDKGRHCHSCNKIVVDFSVMTDRQVLDYFSKTKGNTCGRFHDDQLQRPLIEPETKPSKWSYFLASILGFIMSSKIAAQGDVTKGEVVGKIMPQKKIELVKGDTILPIANEIKGKVVDEKGNAIVGAIVKIKGIARGVSTNANGEFKIISNIDNAVIIVNNIGYKSHYISTKNKADVKIILTDKLDNVDDLIVQFPYGKTNSTYYTGATKTITAAEIKKTKVESFTRILEGLVGNIKAPIDKIKGKVVDEKGNAIAGASVQIKGTRVGVTADSNGLFQLKKLGENNKLTLVFNCIGFATKEIEVITKGFLNDLIISLSEENQSLGDVVVTVPYGHIKGEYVMGSQATICAKPIKSVSIKDSTTKLIQKIFNNESIKIYPNPAPRNTTIHIKLKDAGEYSLQMFDTQSRLITLKNIITKSAKETTEFQLSSYVIAGTYYIRFINEATKRQVTEKITIL